MYQSQTLNVNVIKDKIKKGDVLLANLLRKYIIVSWKTLCRNKSLTLLSFFSSGIHVYKYILLKFLHVLIMLSYLCLRVVYMSALPKQRTTECRLWINSSYLTIYMFIINTCRHVYYNGHSVM